MQQARPGSNADTEKLMESYLFQRDKMPEHLFQ